MGSNISESVVGLVGNRCGRNAFLIASIFFSVKSEARLILRVRMGEKVWRCEETGEGTK